MKGAGVTLAYIFPGMPYWVGVVLVGVVITFNVALGGMKGITLVQAFQYWIKMFAISVPIFVLMSVVGFYNGHIGANKAAGETSAPVTTLGEATRKPLVEKAPKDEIWVAPFGPLTTKAVNAAAAALPPEQRAAYLALIVCGIVLVLSGLAIWKPVQMQELAALFGGFEGARIVHFFAMAILTLIVFVHVVMVILVPRTFPIMITGSTRRPL
jgi:Na+/proline symporter